MNTAPQSYACWLGYDLVNPQTSQDQIKRYLEKICVRSQGLIVDSIKEELTRAAEGLLGGKPEFVNSPQEAGLVVSLIKDMPGQCGKGLEESVELSDEGFCLRNCTGAAGKTLIAARTERGLLYGVFAFLRKLRLGELGEELTIVENPKSPVRMINHWDNMDGSIERGYAGKSIFWENNGLTSNLSRVEDYARLLASLGINSISVNNVNVHQVETHLIGERLPFVERLADIFRRWGIQVFLSINYASPIEVGGLETADPLDPRVEAWWAERADYIYSRIPDFGGFVVKADSEHRPGPFTYDRDHAQGANVLARALRPHGGLVIWRCFVYNCMQDWRDYQTDRARAAYDNFMPLDGKFESNVLLQIKNGPMDFQIREPVSPLFGGLSQTNQVLELQITQEYTGQQIDLCYLVPMWKEVLDFDTYAKGEGSTVKQIVAGKVFPQEHSGIAAVVNVGDDLNWTGHALAQANLYGYGRLCWDTDLSSERIADEWIRLTFGGDEQVVKVVSKMLLKSREIYENYTTPLGIGWMVNPGHHYGPNIDGYEYDRWGTYHRADRDAIGVDRTVKNGTGYAGQYHSPNAEMYESKETCPDELLLFFHRVAYTEKLKSGKTLIQHIYDTHFEGVEQVEWLITQWDSLEGKIDQVTFENVAERLQRQLKNAIEWRDVVNTYFYRKSGIPDEKGRKIY